MIKNKLYISDFLFLSSLSLYMSVSILTRSFFYNYFDKGHFYSTVCIFCIILLCIKELILSNFKLMDIVYLIISLICFFIMLRVSTNIAISALPIFMFSARNISRVKILKVCIFICTFVLLIVIFSSKIGIISNYTGRSNLRTRQYLGFTYVLFGPAILFNITCAIIYLRKKSIKYVTLFLLFLVNLAMFLLTRSNLSFIAAIVAILCAFLFKRFSFDKFFKNKIVMILFCCSYLFFGVLSFFLLSNFSPSNSWMYKVNYLLENRLYYANESLNLFGVKWFGSNVVWQGYDLGPSGVRPLVKYLYVDNFYVNILQQYGIIFTILFIFIITRLLLKSYNKKDYYLLVFMTIFAIHGLVDDLMFTVYYNTFLLFVFNFNDVDKKKIITNNSIKATANNRFIKDKLKNI